MIVLFPEIENTATKKHTSDFFGQEEVCLLQSEINDNTIFAQETIKLQDFFPERLFPEGYHTTLLPN